MNEIFSYLLSPMFFVLSCISASKHENKLKIALLGTAAVLSAVVPRYMLGLDTAADSIERLIGSTLIAGVSALLAWRYGKSAVRS